MYVTYQDLVEHALDYYGADVTVEARRMARRAVQAAYRQMSSEHRWTFYYQYGRLNTYAQVTGSLTYNQATLTATLTTASGSIANATNASPIQITSSNHGLSTGERVTISGVVGNTAANGTFNVTVVDANNFNLDGSTGNGAYVSGGTWSMIWPTWVTDGVLLIGTTTYEVATNPTPTTITLKSASNPGADITTPAPFTLYQDEYILPSDFQESSEFVITQNVRILEHISPTEWSTLHRANWGPSTPVYYTFTGNNNHLGAMAVRFFPPPDSIYPMNFMYKRYPRPLRVEKYSTGTLAISSGQATVTGTGTAWTASMVGSILRISGDPLNAPTSYEGDNPPLYEQIIAGFTSATSLTLDATLGQSLSGLPYTISDPADIDVGAMGTFLLREIERQSRLVRRMPNTPEEIKIYEDAKRDAWAADSRNFSSQAAGFGIDWPVRLADMPYTG